VSYIIAFFRFKGSLRLICLMSSWLRLEILGSGPVCRPEFVIKVYWKLIGDNFVQNNGLQGFHPK
jgi:hypothetical protein